MGWPSICMRAALYTLLLLLPKAMHTSPTTHIHMQVVIQGIAGEGKYIALCQAGQALFRPATDEGDKRADPAELPGYFQAIYTADLTGVDSKDSLEDR